MRRPALLLLATVLSGTACAITHWTPDSVQDGAVVRRDVAATDADVPGADVLNDRVEPDAPDVVVAMDVVDTVVVGMDVQPDVRPDVVVLPDIVTMPDVQPDVRPDVVVCGMRGGACCSSGTPCMSGDRCTGGTCEAPCGLDGEPCCGTGTACTGVAVCVGATCQTACGGPGQDCCASNTCTGGTFCYPFTGGSTCLRCGGRGETCCPGDVCGAGGVCTSNIFGSKACTGAAGGTPGGTCNPLDASSCSGSQFCVADATLMGGHCYVCGALGTPCCGRMCAPSTSCEMAAGYSICR